MIETHAHVYDQIFSNDLDQIIERAKEKGITEIWMPNCDDTTLPSMVQVAQKYPLCKPMIGLHPCYVKSNYLTVLATLEKQLFQEKFIAIGEIGLDLHWDKTYYEEQLEALKIQMEWAKELDLPIIIHARDATRQTLDFFAKNIPQRGIFHCFSGTIEEAEEAVALGFLIGIGGVITYKNSNLSEIVKAVGIRSLVLETDAPYLAPVPFRGKRNEVSYLSYIAQKIAEVLEISLEKVQKQTTENALGLVKI